MPCAGIRNHFSRKQEENMAGTAKFFGFLAVIGIVFMAFAGLWTANGQNVVKNLDTLWVSSSSDTIPKPAEIRDPENVIIPELHPGVPEPPEHIFAHPRSEYTAAIKTAIWNTVMNAFYGGQKPDWCGRRADGALVLFYRALEVFTKAGKSMDNAYKGLAVLLNQGGDNLSTGFSRVTWEGDEIVPSTHNTAQQSGTDFWNFTQIPCPSPSSLGPITQ
jgi:hypothetical protein